MAYLDRPQPNLMPSGRNFNSARVASYAGVNTDRQSRFDARAARRFGDWGILAVPTPFLWLEDIYAPVVPFAFGVDAWPVEEVIELWP
jgi:hypothetical protein